MPRVLSLHFDGGRDRYVARRPVAELPGSVAAPAVDDARRRHAARVVHAEREGRAAKSAGNRDRLRSIRRRSVAELTVGIEAPTVRGAVGGLGAVVIPPSND